MLIFPFRFSTLFFLSIFLLLSVAFGVATLAGWFTLKAGDLEKTQRELVRQMGFFEPLWRQGGDIGPLIETIHAKNNIRLTVIAPDGTVLAESNRPVAGMDNHLSREEVVQARKEGEGYSVRFSDSTLTNHVYYARKVYVGGDAYFLRLAMEANQVRTNFAALWQRVLMIFAFSIAVALWLAVWINRSMAGEVKRLGRLFRSIEDKFFLDSYAPFRIAEFNALGEVALKLSRKLEKRDKKKKEYQAKIRLKNRQQSEVLSAISHEFKNPIAVIKGYCDTLMNDPGMDGAMRARFLKKIANSSDKLTRMLDRFAFATQLENEEFEVKFAPVDLYELGKESVQGMQDKYPNRQIALEGAPRIVQADRMLLEMVLSNLIDNALKYSSEVVTVRIDADRVSVIDRGIGIEPDDLEKVTKKFYRASRLNWDNSMGLGLAIVGFALKRHGSELEIISKPNEGSTFSFKI